LIKKRNHGMLRFHLTQPRQEKRVFALAESWF
jgi:quinol monooxygenase YgiN